MRRAIAVVFVAVAIVAINVACNPFAPDQSVTLDVSKIDAPTTVANAIPITVVLTVTTGGCTSFDHIEVNRDLSGAHMTVWGRDAAKGRTGVACPANIVLEPHSYQFDPPFANSFTIQVDRGRLAPLQAIVQVR
jgi:hypothetical protein